jgi:hypothetical protein
VDLDPADLERVFGRPVDGYTAEPIDPHLRLHSVTGGVYRVRPTDPGLGVQSAVLKIVRHGDGATADGLWGADAEVGARNYWKREWLAFDTGLLDDLPGWLRAPRTLLTTERGDDECWIWMADVAGRTGPAFRTTDVYAAARALGSTQGAYAAGTAPLPDAPWLSRGWLRGWVDVCRTSFVPALYDDAGWDDPRIAPMRPLRPRVAALWERHDDLLRLAESAPDTLVHWDFWPNNVFVDGDGDAAEVVAIDWSQVGISGLTHDLDQLALDPVWMQVLPDASLDDLETAALDGYLAGLRETGCDIAAEQVRQWYAATAAARYAWLAAGQTALVADAGAIASQESRLGRPFAEIAVEKARVVARAVELGEWALASSAR